MLHHDLCWVYAVSAQMFVRTDLRLKRDLWQGPKKTCEIARTRVTILQGIVTKIHPKSSPNPPKMDEKLSKIIVWRGPEGPWARSGSHGGSQGSPGALKCSKTTFVAHPGTPLWDTIFGTFFDFWLFLQHTFSECGFGALRGRFRVDFRMIVEGNFEDFV